MMKTFKNHVEWGGGNSLYHKVLIASIIAILLFAVSCNNEPVYYEVRFNSNGGTVYTVQQVLEGERVLKVANPVKDGHTFEGWFSDPKFAHRYDFNQPVYQNLILYAKWDGGQPVTPEYLTFTSDSKFSITPAYDYDSGEACWNGILEYSTDKINWTEFSKTESTSTSENKTIYIRGKGNNIITGISEVSWAVVPSTAEVSCSGNIMTLLDYEDPDSATMDFGCFAFMFLGVNIVNTSGLILPATTLTAYCYAYMFAGCKSLTDAPALPAMELADYCYTAMFSGAGLKTVPSTLLPATTLAEGCYNGMFSECTELVTVPADLLPAKNLAKECYIGMFAGCEKLTTAPELPATTLAESCYKYMFGSIDWGQAITFQGCKKLTAAPKLPAINLEKDCYNGMFAGCTSLKSVPADLLPAGKIVEGEPKGLLAEGCYSYMFAGSGLETVPSDLLPATTLKKNCYNYMFFKCSDLETVPGDLLPSGKKVEGTPKGSLAEGCYSYMFAGSGLKTVPSNLLPATTLANICYYQMFVDCEFLTTAPTLNVTEFVNDYLGCYTAMFKNCTSLKVEEVFQQESSTKGGTKILYSNSDTSTGDFFTDMFTNTSGHTDDWTPYDGYTYYWYTEN